MERKGEQADRSQNRVGENPSRRLRRNDPACTRRRQKQLHPRSHTRKTPKHTQTRQAPPAGRTDEQYRTRIRRSQKVPRRPRAAHVPARKNQPTHLLHRRNRPQNSRLPPPLQRRHHTRNCRLHKNKPMAHPKQTQENPKKLKKTTRKTNNKLLRRRKVRKKESLVDKRRTHTRITTTHFSAQPSVPNQGPLPSTD